MAEITLDKKLSGLQLIAQEKLQAIICSIPGGQKDLILDHTIIKPLEHICSASWLKLKGIHKIYKFDAANQIPRPRDHVHIFMIRSSVDMFQRVLKHIHDIEREEPSDVNATIKNFHIICVPSCFACFHHVLEEEGLYGLVQLHRFHWDFIYLDQGVLSLEIANVFSSAFMREDPSLLPAIAHSLRIMQMVCGVPDLILSYGECAANIIKIMNTLGSWPQEDTAMPTSDFSAMIIFDRDKDYASSLLTPAIYAGLLLEVFNNRAGDLQIEAESNKILRQKLEIFLLPKHKQKNSSNEANKDSQSTQKSVVIHMNSLSDEIYGENRYKHFTQASSLVRAQAKAIGLEVQKLNDMKLEEMHEYVARKLPKITELKAKVMRHLNASETVIEMLGNNFRKLQSLEEDILNNVTRKRVLTEIDELLLTDGQKYNTLRLFCLLHLCSGVSSEELCLFIRNYCNYFGFQNLHAFEYLAQAGLLPHVPVEEEKPTSAVATKLLSNLPIPKFQQTEFQANANRLKLLVSCSGAEATPRTSEQCPSYVFNSLYIPLVAQLCSFLKSQSADEFSMKISMVEKIQIHLPDGQAYSGKNFATHVKQSDVKDPFPLRKPNILVYVVGGVTMAEVGACDLVARLTDSQIIVSSDCIIAGCDLIAGAF